MTILTPRSWWRASVLTALALSAAMVASNGRAEDRQQARIALGRFLFEDRNLSFRGNLACISCHRPEAGWTDAKPRATGEEGRLGRRNTPTLAGVGRRQAFFWDGAVQSLDEATLRPLFDPAEMANPSAAAFVEKLRSDPLYPASFDRAFGTPDISVARAGTALAAFVGTLDSSSRYDRYRAGDGSALDEEERRGLALFEGKAGCSGCHTGADLTDEAFHNTGLAMPGETGADAGRYGVTTIPDDAGRFRTPSLRMTGTTAPYMHNGAFPDLEAVVRFYERGGGTPWLRNEEQANDAILREMARISPRLRPIALSPEERHALIAFLQAL